MHQELPAVESIIVDIPPAYDTLSSCSDKDLPSYEYIARQAYARKHLRSSSFERNLEDGAKRMKILMLNNFSRSLDE